MTSSTPMFATDVEVSLWLVAAEARQAAGSMESAQQALSEALKQLHLRADQIPDPEQRERFLSQVPDNARTRELARMYLGRQH